MVNTWQLPEQDVPRMTAVAVNFPAAVGNTEALAKHYFTTGNYAQAVKWSKLCLQHHGGGSAYGILAFCYENGLGGLPVDIPTACALLRCENPFV